MTSKNAGSGRKGKATEQLIAATCILGTGGKLNALTSLVDDEGIDITFKRRDRFRTLDIQVKARFSDDAGSKKLREEGMFTADVREETFSPRRDLCMLYVVVDAPSADVNPVWLVPSQVLNAEGFRVRPNGKPHVRFQASSKHGSKDKWRQYRMSRAALPGDS